MTEWPEVTVVVCTYDRPREIRRTLESLITNLIYPPHRLRWHIADDGTGGVYAEMVEEFIFNSVRFLRRHEPRITHTITERKGWGVNVNTALRAVQTDYTFFTEDDYVLTRELDLREHVALIDVVPSVGLVRFGLAGHEGIAGYIREAHVRNWLPDFIETPNSAPGKLTYFEIERGVSAGPVAFYKYSNRPHLKHRRFHEAYGMYPEGQVLALTEEGMNHQIQHVAIGPAIVCPADWLLWHFDHIGTSRQGTEADLHAARS